MERARAAEPADLPRIVELARRLREELRSQRGGALWETREPRAEPLEASLGDFLERDDAAVVVGTLDDHVVAYGTLDLQRLRDGKLLGVIDDLYVQPEARGVGVGEAVAADLVERCVAAGCIGIDAFALPGNREAKNFFERGGFTARALVMHKPLATSDE